MSEYRLTDEEILEGWDFYEDLEEKEDRFPLQCWWCGGWYWFDKCNIENDEVKRQFLRYLELREEDLKEAIKNQKV